MYCHILLVKKLTCDFTTSGPYQYSTWNALNVMQMWDFVQNELVLNGLIFCYDLYMIQMLT